MTISKNIFIKILFSIFLITTVSSCDEGGDPDREEIGMTTTGKYAGDWYITLTDSDGVVLAEHVLHSTYNTSANDNSMWIDDHELGYYIKSKFNINTETGQFSIVDSPNIIDSGTVTITEGQIIENGAVSRGGHTVDRITCRVHFSYDDPGYDIIYEGHRRTGFFEDEY